MIVIGYVTAWLPYNVVALLAKYHRPLGESDHFPYIFVACHWLAMSHSVYNPIIYFWLNDSFRTTVLEIFCRKKARERRRVSSTMFSWRTSTGFTNGRSSSITRNSGRLKRIQSPSESSYPCSPAWKLPKNPNDVINGQDEETMIIISNGEADNLSHEKVQENPE